MAVAHRHVGGAVGRIGQVGVEAHEIGRAHAGRGKDRQKVGEARLGLLRDESGTVPSGAMPSWPETYEPARVGGTSVAWL